jgi:hypothetical protein
MCRYLYNIYISPDSFTEVAGACRRSGCAKVIEGANYAEADWKDQAGTLGDTQWISQFRTGQEAVYTIYNHCICI